MPLRREGALLNTGTFDSYLPFPMPADTVQIGIFSDLDWLPTFVTAAGNPNIPVLCASPVGMLFKIASPRREVEGLCHF